MSVLAVTIYPIVTTTGSQLWRWILTAPKVVYNSLCSNPIHDDRNPPLACSMPEPMPLFAASTTLSPVSYRRLKAEEDNRRAPCEEGAWIVEGSKTRPAAISWIRWKGITAALLCGERGGGRASNDLQAGLGHE